MSRDAYRDIGGRECLEHILEDARLHGPRYPLEGCAGVRATQDAYREVSGRKCREHVFEARAEDAYMDVGGRTAPGASSRNPKQRFLESDK